MKAVFIAFALVVVSVSSAKAASLTPIGSLERGTMVMMEGSVDRILDTDEFRLADDSGAVRIYVGPNWAPVDVGERVTVQGFVDDGIGPLEVYARSMTREDGTELTFSHQY
jgi:uncharacterized protein YdeI (BOF family)